MHDDSPDKSFNSYFSFHCSDQQLEMSEQKIFAVPNVTGRGGTIAFVIIAGNSAFSVSCYKSSESSVCMLELLQIIILIPTWQGCVSWLRHWYQLRHWHQVCWDIIAK